MLLGPDDVVELLVDRYRARDYVDLIRGYCADSPSPFRVSLPFRDYAVFLTATMC